MFELISSMVLWGTLGVFVLWSKLSAIDIAFYRCLIGVIFTGFWMINSRQTLKINKDILITAVAGIFLVLNWVFLFKSFQVSSITIGNMSYYLQPIILLILGIFFYKEKVNMQQWFYISLALLGVALTINMNKLYSPHIILGVGLALIAALFYSLFTILMKYTHVNNFKVIFIQLTIGALLLLPLTNFKSLSHMQYLCLIVIGMIHTLLAYYLYFNAIKKTTLAQIAIVSYLDPIVAIITDIIFFGAQLNILQMMGVGMTFISLYLLLIKPRTTKENDLQAEAI